MNFVGKFDASCLSDGLTAHSHVHVEHPSTHAPADAIIVPDAHLLFGGDFKRAGVDLILSNDDRELVVHDYFKGEKPPPLASPDGAHLTGDIVNALAGQVEYCAGRRRLPPSPHVIGHVTKLTGSATAIRNGVSIILNQGDNVEKGDVVAIRLRIRRSASPSSTAPCSACRRTPGWCSTKWSTTPTGRTIPR